MVPWYKKNPERYFREKQEVKSKYPELHFCEVDPFVVVRGTFPVLGNSGRILARYDIEVKVPPAYPAELPVVYEVGGDIPRRSDRHVNTVRGECCLEAEVDFWMRHGPGYRLIDFLDGPVRSFFASQSYFELMEEWPHGERSHGREGIFEAYEEILNTQDRGEICRWIYMLSQKELHPQYHCPCGSRTPIRDCHFDLYVRLRKRIPRPVAERSLMRLVHHPDYSLVW